MAVALHEELDAVREDQLKERKIIENITSIMRAEFLKIREQNNRSVLLEHPGTVLRCGVKYLKVADQFLEFLDKQENLFREGYESQEWYPEELHGYIEEYAVFFRRRIKDFFDWQERVMEPAEVYLLIAKMGLDLEVEEEAPEVTEMVEPNRPGESFENPIVIEDDEVGKENA
ncbi:hypothetical protein BKA66DRAFT_568167 [Pyrenochaeta sp. MPI-SDFR-AT-0127]|nr:hypothetical protein BKA66DRAFT_568167 [Pyrenochaeta sp. MPI-SDFR-AT-0127]